MRGRILPLRDLSARDLGAWRELCHRAAEPNPLFEPACLVPAARHLARGREIALVVAEEGGEMLGAMPVRVEPRWHRAPVTTATTDVRRMTYLGTPLVDADRPAPALHAMLQALADAGHAGRAGLAELRWVHAGGPVHGAMQQVLSEGWTATVAERFDRPFLARRPGLSYSDHLDSKFRRDRLRLRRRLEEHLGGEVAIVDRRGSSEAVQELIDLEHSGYKGRTGISLASVAGEPRYFTEMCAAFAEDGRLQVLALEGGGRTVAMLASVRGAGGLFALKIAHDETLSRFGPGVALHLGSFEHFHVEAGAAWIDTCTFSGNESLLRLYPDRRAIVTYLVALHRGGTGFVKLLPHVRRVREGWHGRARKGPRTVAEAKPRRRGVAAGP